MGATLTRKTPLRRLLFVALLPLAATPGCSLIFGGDQRVDNKSHNYTLVRLDREKPGEWHSLTLARQEAEAGSHQSSPVRDTNTPTPDDTGDIAFEHAASGSIISVDSVCHEYRDASLDELSRHLLMGLNTKGPIVTREISINGIEGMENTVDAFMHQRSPSGEHQENPVRVKAVVLKHSGCVYDLMYIARPGEFAKHQPTFERFLKGFHAH